MVAQSQEIACTAAAIFGVAWPSRPKFSSCIPQPVEACRLQRCPNDSGRRFGGRLVPDSDGRNPTNCVSGQLLARFDYLWSAVVVAFVFWGGAVMPLVLRKSSQ
jgi:hypothetical protein